MKPTPAQRRALEALRGDVEASEYRGCYITVRGNQWIGVRIPKPTIEAIVRRGWAAGERNQYGTFRCRLTDAGREALAAPARAGE